MHHYTIPKLTTALTAPLHQLEQYLLNKQCAIEHWFLQQWQLTPPPVTTSVDLRNAGFKLAPVDTNLFPAGFNNLNPEFLPLCIHAMQSALSKIKPLPKNVLLIPENHTRNPFYLESLSVLHAILVKAGFTTRIGTLRPDVSEPTTLTLSSGTTLLIEPITRKNDQLTIDDFIPELILLNNDLSDGIPDLLKGLKQPITAPAELGWGHRLKSDHFAHYNVICDEIASLINIDPWLINPIFRHCGEIDFMTRQGETCLVDNATIVFNAIKKKYEEYNIPSEPFLVIKADAGTYGMGIMIVKSIEELQQLNRRQRTRMSKTKGSKTITQVIIQEGVYSFETWQTENAVAEPVIYMVGSHVVGGFYRVHRERSSSENLNAPGMHFEQLSFANTTGPTSAIGCCPIDMSECELPECEHEPMKLSSEHCNTSGSESAKNIPNRFYAYSVIARLALLAAARELTEVQ